MKTKLSFPLYARVLGWFFLNLLLLVAGFYLVARFQFRFRLDTLLMGQAGERLDAMGAVIVGELRHRPRADWDALLARFGEGYGVRFAGFAADGTQLAGEAMSLPAEALARINESRVRVGPLGGRGGPGGPGGPPNRGERGERGGPRFKREVEPIRPGTGDHPPEPPLGGPSLGTSRIKFIVQAAATGKYWIGLRVLPPEPGQNQVGPMMLFAVSPTLSAGGLLFDPWPWVLAALGAVLLSLLFWFPFVRRITRALSGMTAATERIAEGNFETRAAVGRGDELGRLGVAIDRMAARLAGFVMGQKRFLGDVAHELCSPLARMEMALGVLDQRSDEKQREYVADVREEVRHMSGLVDELLSFSKAGLRPKDVALVRVQVRELVERVVAREVVNQGLIQLEVPLDLMVQAEPELLARALGNLLRNAVRYAGDHGPIAVSARLDGTRVRLTVADQGPGVSVAELARLGEPFYRPDLARTREGGGAGLGLAIVRQCVAACGGTLNLRNGERSGLVAEIVLQPG